MEKIYMKRSDFKHDIVKYLMKLNHITGNYDRLLIKPNDGYVYLEFAAKSRFDYVLKAETIIAIEDIKDANVADFIKRNSDCIIQIDK